MEGSLSDHKGLDSIMNELNLFDTLRNTNLRWKHISDRIRIVSVAFVLTTSGIHISFDFRAMI